jgi:hypothetical protein
MNLPATPGEFTVNNGSTDAVTAAALEGNPDIVDLTVTTPIQSGQTVTVSYSGTDVTSTDGGVLASFSDQSVTNNVLTTINTAAIAGVTAPVAGATPVSSISPTSEYTATISWSGSPVTFASGTAYTATITITPASGYTLTGVPANYFTVAGATATNSAGSGVVSAVFPATAGSAKAITAFSFNGLTPAVTATINGTAITATVPYGTSVTALVATFTTTGASVKVGSTVQVSGTTQNDFTNPVTYTVTAADNSTQNYTVTVTVGSNTAALITSFNFTSLSVTGTINNTPNPHTVSLTVPYGTNVTGLTPTIAVSPGATVSPASGVAKDFTNPVAYTVTAQDTVTTQAYTVTVTVAPQVIISVTGITLNEHAATLTVGNTDNLIATVSPSNATDQVVTWSSNNTNVASVNSSGLVSAAGAGSATITATAQDTTNGVLTDTDSLTVNAPPPTTGPTITNVFSATTSSGVTITWTTSVNASSKVDYGLTNSYGSSTTETDTSTRVTSHSVSLTDLSSCATYHYRVRSTDVFSNETIDNDNTFTTTGCINSALVVATSTAQITAVSGGSLTLQNSNSDGLTLTVPPSSTGSDANFQAHQLDATTVLASTSVPSGTRSVGNYIYQLGALTDTATTVSTFNQPLTVTIAYSASDVSGINQSSLTIYRYDAGTGWTQLTGCVVNTTSQTVTCTTSNFSVFGLFGQAQAVVTPTVTNTGGGGNMLLLQMLQQAELRKADPTTQAQPPLTTSQGHKFTKDLKLGSVDMQVKYLQQYLNSHGFPVAQTGAGSPGKETTKFGYATKAALIKFQEAHADQILRPWFTHGTGIFGPMTRGYINLGK